MRTRTWSGCGRTRACRWGFGPRRRGAVAAWFVECCPSACAQALQTPGKQAQQGLALERLPTEQPLPAACTQQLHFCQHLTTPAPHDTPAAGLLGRGDQEEAGGAHRGGALPGHQPPGGRELQVGAPPLLWAPPPAVQSAVEPAMLHGPHWGDCLAPAGWQAPVGGGGQPKECALTGCQAAGAPYCCAGSCARASRGGCPTRRGARGAADCATSRAPSSIASSTNSSTRRGWRQSRCLAGRWDGQGCRTGKLWELGQGQCWAGRLGWRQPHAGQLPLHQECRRRQSGQVPQAPRHAALTPPPVLMAF